MANTEEKRIYLHIGTHKTGTTSIQMALSQGGDFHYPETGRNVAHGVRSPGQHLLAASAIPGADARVHSPSRRLWDQIRVSGKTIISSETFCKATAEDVSRIRKYLADHPVTVILYVRNHFQFSVSAYKQVVKQGTFAGTFRENVERTMVRLDYDAMIHRWREHFDVDVRFYDKVKSRLLQDFAQAVNVEELRPAGLRNVTPSDKTLVAVRFMHKTFPGRMRRAKANVLDNRLPGRYLTAMIGHGQLVRDSDRAWFMKRTREMRMRFLENHVAPEDTHYFD